MKRELSEAAITAKAVKKELKKEFPGIKFSITSETFSMGNSVQINWTDGPTLEQVENVSDKYRYGYFDGSNDLYVSNNKRDDVPQVKFVQSFRNMSRETEREIVKELQKKYRCCKGKNRDSWIEKFNASMRQLVWREFYEKSYC